MNIRILQLLEGARSARGIAVIIDVFRAFTVEPYLVNCGAEKIIPVGDVQLAWDYKARHPDAILCGERHGIKLPGFDFGNSPSAFEDLDLTGRTVIHTTSAGTQGIANAVHAHEILTGSLVNARAIANYIRARDPQEVSLVCMGLDAVQETQEDTLCARYIKALLEDSPAPDWAQEIALLRKTSGAKFFDPKQQSIFPERDFHLSVQVDTMPFVLRLKHSPDGLHYMEKISL